MSDALRPTAESVQRLVRDVVQDRPARDDAAQEAWLVALRRGWRGPDVGRWLAGAARRIARSTRREEASRRVREQRAARPEATDSALETLARIEAVQRVVAAVHDLDEPFRQAVVLRYFDDLPPRKLARALGVPVNTARSRVRRGIESLRLRLEARDFVALAPFALRARPMELDLSPAAGLALAAAGAALLGGALLVATRWSTERALDSVPPRAAGSGFAAAPADEGLRPGGASAARREPVASSPFDVARADVDSGVAEAPAERSPGRGATELRGRFLRADGSPASDLQLVLRVHARVNTLSGRGLRSPADELAAWREPETATDAEEFFALRFELPSGYSFALEVPQAPEQRVVLARLAPGRAHELGDVVLDRGAALAGVLLDGARRPLLQRGWTVGFTSAGERCGAGLLEVCAEAEVDPLTGAFRFEHLPGRELVLSAVNELGAESAEATVHLVRGATSEVELAYAGPDLARRIRLTFVNEWGAAAPAPEAVTLTDGSGRAHAATVFASSTLFFDDLQPFFHEAAVDDERFLPWRRADLVAGTRIDVELRGSAALELSALERDTGAPLAAFEVQLRRADGPVRRLAGGRIDGLVPGAYTLVASAHSRADETLAFELAPGETRALVLAFAPRPNLTDPRLQPRSPSPPVTDR